MKKGGALATADAPFRYGGAEALVGGPARTEGGICCTNAVLAGTHGALLAKCSVLYLAGGCADNMREAVAGSHEQQSVCKTATGKRLDACQLIGGRSAVFEG